MFINKQEIYFRPNSSLYRSIYLGFRANVNTELYGEVVSCLQIKGNVISSVGNSSTVDIHLVSDAEVHCILSSATSARVQVPRCAFSLPAHGVKQTRQPTGFPVDLLTNS